MAHELQVRLSGVPAVNHTEIGSADNPDIAEKKPAPKRRAGRSVSHPRRMASSTRVLPLWAGRCSCLQMLCRSWISSRTCDETTSETPQLYQGAEGKSLPRVKASKLQT